MCAKWLGDALTASESIHDAYIALHQFPHLDHKLNVPATNIAIRDVMAHELCVRCAVFSLLFSFGKRFRILHSASVSFSSQASDSAKFSLHRICP
jgi:hypothetical protein